MPLDLTSRCGDNVTLKCEATVPEQMEIKQFSWVHPNKSCGHREQERKPWCESVCEPPRCSLALTLVNMMPVDQGQYLCKLRSTMGVFYNHSVVTVQGEPTWIVSKLQSRPAKLKVLNLEPSFQIASSLWKPPSTRPTPAAASVAFTPLGWSTGPGATLT